MINVPRAHKIDRRVVRYQPWLKLFIKSSINGRV